LAFGIPSIQLDPFEWVSAPVILFEAAYREKATISWMPNFAYNLMADRIHEEDLCSIRLDSFRMLTNCSEPVRFSSHEKFANRFEPYGLRREVLAACYAMAETTFAVTQTVPGIEAAVLEASREDLSSGRYRSAVPGKNSIKCVSSGQPISGCEVRIVDSQFHPVEEGHVGEIAIRSASMFNGYRKNPEKTAAVMKDGWYCSGDYGFVWKGECYILGRKKDIIIVAGKNIYPDDIEYAIADTPGVIPGRVVAFGLDNDDTGTEEVCVIAETSKEDPQERKSLQAAIVKAGMAVDVTISRIYLAPPRWLFKSSSGKPSRSANKQRALSLDSL
jgi:fatty-acyl-CoA synthase